MNRDEVLEALFRHALLMHGFATGALLRDRSLNAKAIFAEMEPLRARLVALYIAAGFEVPEALQADDESKEPAK